jgi:hypothetical protein
MKPTLDIKAKVSNLCLSKSIFYQSVLSQITLKKKHHRTHQSSLYPTS